MLILVHDFQQVKWDLNFIWERGTFPDFDIFYQNFSSDGSYSIEGLWQYLMPQVINLLLSWLAI
ncbi:hypothetical protein Ct9H90mP29_05720 [bacterium]|nr:MAG: hypothetical protein Ct9H90mP29_05720 [bacterium]